MLNRLVAPSILVSRLAAPSRVGTEAAGLSVGWPPAGCIEVGLAEQLKHSNTLVAYTVSSSGEPPAVPYSSYSSVSVHTQDLPLTRLYLDDGRIQVGHY